MIELTVKDVISLYCNRISARTAQRKLADVRINYGLAPTTKVTLEQFISVHRIASDVAKAILTTPKRAK